MEYRYIKIFLNTETQLKAMNTFLLTYKLI